LSEDGGFYGKTWSRKFAAFSVVLQHQQGIGGASKVDGGSRATPTLSLQGHCLFSIICFIPFKKTFAILPNPNAFLARNSYRLDSLNNHRRSSTSTVANCRNTILARLKLME